MKYLVIFIVFLSGSSLCAQTNYPQPQRVNGDLWTVPLDGCNAAFLVTDSGIVVIDAGISPIDGWNLKASIASVSDKPVKYVILTHHHFDHVGGVQVFLPEAKVIAQEGFYENMAGPGQKIAAEFIVELEAGYQAYQQANQAKIDELTSSGNTRSADSISTNIQYYRSYIDSCKAVRLFKPDIEFAKSYTLEIGNHSIQLVHPGAAHTGSDCIVYFPKYSAAHLGDLYFEKSFPFLDGPAGASVENWIKILKKLSSKKSNMFLLCGHGQITNRFDLLIMRQLLIDVQNEVKAAKAKGLTVDEAVKSITLSQYENYPGRDLLEKNVRWLFEQTK